jgi:hypothetical protein
MNEYNFENLLLDVLYFIELTEQLGYHRLDIIKSIENPQIIWIPRNNSCKEVDEMKKKIIKEKYEKLKRKYEKG